MFPELVHHLEATPYIGRFMDQFLSGIDPRKILVLGPGYGHELLHLRRRFPQSMITAVETRTDPLLTAIIKATDARLIRLGSSDTPYIPYGRYPEIRWGRHQDFPDLTLLRNLPVGDSGGLDISLALLMSHLQEQEGGKRIVVSVAYPEEKESLKADILDQYGLSYSEYSFTEGTLCSAADGESSTTDRFVFVSTSPDV